MGSIFQNDKVKYYEASDHDEQCLSCTKTSLRLLSTKKYLLKLFNASPLITTKTELHEELKANQNLTRKAMDGSIIALCYQRNDNDLGCPQLRRLEVEFGATSSARS